MTEAFKIFEDIQRKVMDDSYTFPVVLNILNDGLDHITSSILLPALDASSAVTTTSAASYVSLPSDYSRNLYRCWSETNEAVVDVYPNVDALLRDHEGNIDDNGAVSGVTVWGSNLFYHLIPATADETLRLYYHKAHTALTEEGSEPDCLPSHLDKRLLVNYACAEIFAEIEDGTDTSRNSMKYELRFAQVMADLAAYVHSLAPPYRSVSKGWI